MSSAPDLDIFLETNLKRVGSHAILQDRLRDTAPDEAAQLSTTLGPVPGMQLLGRPIYDTSDPIGEASRQVEGLVGDDDACLVVLFGFGLGYHAEQLERRFKKRVIVFDPSLQALHRALSCRPLPLSRTSVISDITYLMSETQLHLQFSDHNMVVAAIPAYVELFPEEFARFKDALEHATAHAKIMEETIASRTKNWIGHVAQNLPRASRLHGFEVFGDRFRGKPGILISAGPSLDKNIDVLREAMGHALLITVNTAVPSVARGGVVPSIVAVVEGLDLRRQFEVPWLDQIVLAPALISYPPFFDMPVRHVIPIADQSAITGEWLDRAYGRKRYATGGSVSCSAFSILEALGCDPIILVGQDLAYTGGARYPEGAKFGRQRMRFDEETQTLLAVDRNAELEKIRIDGGLTAEVTLKGEELEAWGGKGTVFTSKIFGLFRAWFEQMAAAHSSHTRLINATEGGARIRGFEEMPLREALDIYCKEPLPARDIIDEAILAAPMPDPSPAAEVLEEDLEFIRQTRRTAVDASTTARAAIEKLETGDVERAQELMSALNALEEQLSSVSGEMKLLDIFVAAQVNALRLGRKQDLADDPSLQAANALRREMKLFRAIERGAEELIEIFEPVLERIAREEPR